jgi:hypothetical protein
VLSADAGTAVRCGRAFLALASLCGACGGIPSGDLSEPASEPALDVKRHGLVALEARVRTEERGPRFDGAAFFWQASAAENNGCEVIREVDGCEISLCLPIAAAAQPLPGFEWLSAGKVDVSGTKFAFSFTESELGDYATTLPSREMSLWDGGELLRVSVGGSRDFPAIETAVTAPRAVALVSPDLSAAPRVDPSAGLVLEWSSPSVDSLYVEIEERSAAPYPKQREPFAVCTFSAERGRGFIPAGVFDEFSAPNTLHGYRFRVMTDSQVELEVDGAGFTLVALSQSAEFELPIGSGEARALPAKTEPVAPDRTAAPLRRSR